MHTALVTGAAGFIGSHLVEGLRSRGYRVRGFDNCSSGDRSRLDDVWADEDFEFVEGDVRDERAVRETMEGVDVVFHHAADTSVPASFDRPAWVTDVNCTGTATVLEAAREAAVDSLVFASSASVYGSDVSPPTPEDAPLRPESPYALSKRYGEDLLDIANGDEGADGDGSGDADSDDENGLDAVAVRYFNVYGPGQDPSGPYAAVIPAFVERLLAGDPPVIYGDGGQTRDFVHVADVVDATIRAAERDCSGPINVGNGQRTSIHELATTLRDILGVDVDPELAPPREGDVRHSGADITRAREQLDFEPSVGLREGLENTVAAYRDDRV